MFAKYLLGFDQDMADLFAETLWLRHPDRLFRYADHRWGAMRLRLRPDGRLLGRSSADELQDR